MAVIGLASITPAFPDVSKSLNVPIEKVGLLISVFSLPGIILTPVLGILADRFGRKIVLVPSLFLFGIAGTFCSIAPSFEWLMAIRFLQGIGSASLGALNVTLIGDLFKKEERASVIGYNNSVLSIGTAIFPLVGGLLASLTWRLTFVLPILGLVSGMLVIFNLQNGKLTDGETSFKTYLKISFNTIKSFKLIFLLFISVATYMILFGSYWTYLPFFVEKRLGGSSTVTGLILFATSLFTAASASLYGKIVKRISKKTILLISFLSYGIAIFFIPISASYFALAIPIVFYGIGHGLNLSNTQNWIISLAPEDNRAVFMSLNRTLSQIGHVSGPILAGIIYNFGSDPISSISIVFFSAAAFAVTIFVLITLFLKN